MDEQTRRPLTPGSHRQGARRRRRFGRRQTTSLVVLAGLSLSAGCEVDGFIEPGRLERLEKTATITPVLERLPQIEGPLGEGVEYSKILPEDLIPDPAAYRLGPGDVLEIEVQDLIVGNQPERLERDVDPRGFVDLPRLPSINVNNKTVEQFQNQVSEAIRAARLIDNPVVAVRVLSRRQLTYNVIGGVAQPGAYAIARPDFRLLEALAQAGRFNENISYLYIVRGVPLSERVGIRPMSGTGFGTGGSTTGPSTGPTGTQPPTNPPANVHGNPGNTTPAKPPENVIDLIDEIAPPSSPAGTSGTPPTGAAGPTGGSPAAFQPGNFQPGGAMGADARPLPPPAGSAGATGPGIDLPDHTAPGGGGNSAQPEPVPYPEVQEGPDWVFLNGQWVKASRRNLQQGVDTPMPGNGGAAVQPPVNQAADLYTQRVIRVEVGPLMAGAAQYNIIVRPGDIIRVPSPSEGLVYVAGEVSRPGPYNIPASGKLTALRAITAAGGLSQTAIPWRAEILRMVGPDRQAIMRIDLKAIAEGTQPDIFLKPDDQLNVGTNFWAYPLAVIRQGFRASYGFGFILDRNFGPDVFGERQFGGN